ncbi:MAG: sigma-54-dependent Fis family transcriptional regulator [Deltaproteobacteria bacterium]|nr:sigma-54-dependent Fis family transcriptional regulator [Deltaproteobacteria bacterium]
MSTVMAQPGEDNEVLLSVHDLIGREVALDDLLRTMIDRIRTAMRADRCTLYLVDHGKGEVFSKAAHLPELPEIRLKLGQGVAGHVAQTGELVNVPSAKEDARFYGGVDEKTGYRTESMLAAAVRDRAGNIVGVVQLLNKLDGHFTDEDARLLTELSRQAGMAIESTTLHAQLLRPAAEATEPVPLQDRFNRIVGESAPMRQVYKLTTRAAASQATVLITGESGTGKELFARAVHVNSPRRDGAFVKVDCAALPASLIENELFGHERGAYTGADQRAVGKFDAAQKGTIFLDEIGELPLPVQGKLLRVLQDRDFERVGGNRPVEVDVRIVAATNRDLEKMVAAGTFRADLYYRIKVVEIRLPPLRARGPDDIGRLAKHFVTQAARRHARAVPTLSAVAMSRLCAYPWPGNVRELENCVESAVVIMDGREILPEHLPLPEATPALHAPSEMSPSRLPTPLAIPLSGNLPPTKPLADVEKEHILHVLDLVQGNRSLAARVLQIGRNTLARKLKDYGM